MSALMDSGTWDRSFTGAIDGYSSIASMWLIRRDMLWETNRVTLDLKAKGKLGRPVAAVHLDDHPNDIAMRAHAVQ